MELPENLPVRQRDRAMPALLPVLAMLAVAAQPADTISDDALVAYAQKPYSKIEMMGHHDVVGLQHGVEIIADFPCSDLCPNYTTRIIHYAVEPGPDCDRIGGRARDQLVPFSIAVVRKTFCVPGVLVEKKLF
jgi:hypothetical protein